MALVEVKKKWYTKILDYFKRKIRNKGQYKMADNLIEKCNKYIEKGKIDKLYNYIKSNNLTQEFVKQSFYKTYNTRFKDKEYEDMMNVTNFALKISMDELTAKYGDKLANKFSEIIYNTPQPSKRMFNLFRLMNSR